MRRTGILEFVVTVLCEVSRIPRGWQWLSRKTRLHADLAYRGGLKCNHEVCSLVFERWLLATES